MTLYLFVWFKNLSGTTSSEFVVSLKKIVPEWKNVPINKFIVYWKPKNASSLAEIPACGLPRDLVINETVLYVFVLKSEAN
jgi:hypothetical protein